MSEERTTPKQVHLIIENRGWALVNSSEPGRPYNIYPSQSLVSAYMDAMRGSDPERKVASYAQWTIGPVEIARILERLGIQVNITVERWV